MLRIDRLNKYLARKPLSPDVSLNLNSKHYCNCWETSISIRGLQTQKEVRIHSGGEGLGNYQPNSFFVTILDSKCRFRGSAAPWLQRKGCATKMLHRTTSHCVRCEGTHQIKTNQKAGESRPISWCAHRDYLLFSQSSIQPSKMLICCCTCSWWTCKDSIGAVASCVSLNTSAAVPTHRSAHCKYCTYWKCIQRSWTIFCCHFLTHSFKNLQSMSMQHAQEKSMPWWPYSNFIFSFFFFHAFLESF